MCQTLQFNPTSGPLLLIQALAAPMSRTVKQWSVYETHVHVLFNMLPTHVTSDT